MTLTVAVWLDNNSSSSAAEAVEVKEEEQQQHQEQQQERESSVRAATHRPASECASRHLPFHFPFHSIPGYVTFVKQNMCHEQGGGVGRCREGAVSDLLPDLLVFAWQPVLQNRNIFSWPPEHGRPNPLPLHTVPLPLPLLG